MCGPVVAWDWIVIDVSYVMVLIGGAVILRARNAGVGTWIAFGGLSTFVGVILFTFTFETQAAYAAAGPDGPVAMLKGAC